MLCLPVGALAAYQGYRAATDQFTKVNELTIYESRLSMWRVRSNFRWMGAMGYGIPVMVRTFTFVAFLLGVPALAGVYRDDKDRVSHYVVSAGFGAMLVTLMTTSSEYRGVRQKIVAAGLGMLPGLLAGLLFTQGQKQDIYPFYDLYKERWRNIDPLWADFVERQDNLEESLAVPGSSGHVMQNEQNLVDVKNLLEEKKLLDEKIFLDKKKFVDEVNSNPPSVSSDVDMSNRSSEECIESAEVEDKL